MKCIKFLILNWRNISLLLCTKTFLLVKTRYYFENSIISLKRIVNVTSDKDIFCNFVNVCAVLGTSTIIKGKTIELLQIIWKSGMKVTSKKIVLS